MSPAKKAFKSSVAISFSTRIVAYVFSFGVSIVISRYYGAEVLGYYAFILAVQALMAIFFSLGSDLSTVKFISQNKALSNENEVNNWLVSTCQLRVLLGVIAAVTFTLIAIVYFYKEGLELSLGFTAMLGFTLFLLLLRNYFMNVARGLNRVAKTFVYNEFTLNLARFILLLAIATLISSPNFSHVIGVHLVSVTVSLILMRLLVKDCNFTGKWTENIKSSSTIIKYSMPFLLQNAAWLIMSFTSAIVLGLLSTAEDVAGYDVSFKLAMVTALLLNVINAIIAPKFSTLYAESKVAELKLLTKKLSRVLAGLSLPILLIYIVFGQDVLAMWGESFTGYYELLVILAVGQFYNVSTGSVGMLLTMTDYVQLAKKIALFAAFLNIVLNILLVVLYGAKGAAIATALSIIFMNTAYLIAVRNKLGFYTF